MKRHLSNLDEILEDVRNSNSRQYLNEAISAYRVGAYRASLVTTWIAVCVDITEKIRELDIGGDSLAKKINERLTKIEPNNFSAMMNFEREILQYACDDLQLISHIEKTHLERLKDDRNICAHPTFSTDGHQFSPNAELTLSYIVQAANYLLSQRPVKGKAVIEKTYNLIKQDSFPNDEDAAFSLLSSENQLGRAKHSSIRNLCIILLKRIFSEKEKISETLFDKIMSALGAISRIQPEVYNETVKEKLNILLNDTEDQELKRAFPFLSRQHDSWNKVDESVKIRLDGLLMSLPKKEVIFYRITDLSEKNHRIREKYLEKIRSLDEESTISLFSSNSSWVNKDIAISLFSKSKSYDSSEIMGNKILIPLSKHFSTEDLRKVLDAALNNTGLYGKNQILYAGSIDHFFSGLYEETKNHIPDHRQIWKDFWASVEEKGDIIYDQLYEAMEKDGLVEPTRMPEEDFNLPF